MKTKSILLFVLSAMVLLATSCKEKKDEPRELQSISISPTLSVAEGGTATLTATLSPSDADATITWESSNTSVATITGTGKTVVVNGVAEGTATIYAKSGSITSNACAVTVTDGGTPPPPPPCTGHSSLCEGKEYFIIWLDATSTSKLTDRLGASKVHYIGSDDAAGRELQVWEGTYKFNASSGPNLYGVVADWLSLEATDEWWSGGGITAGTIPLTGMKQITDNPSEWYFHIAIKANTVNAAESPWFILGGGGAGNEAKFALGPKDVRDEQKAEDIKTMGNFTRDGEWNSIEFSIASLKAAYPASNANFKYSDAVTDANLFSFLFGGAPNTLEIDAIFIYKK